MQSVVRGAIADLARGISTGVIVWTGCRCPDHLCSPQLHCPDCICSAGERLPAPLEQRNAADYIITVLVGLVCFLAGVLYQQHCRHGSERRKSSPNLADEARSQLAQLRRKNHGSSSG
jgi:hypothetical protein